MAAEFDLIKQYFQDPANAQYADNIVCGIGDDCAVLNIPQGWQLTVSVDSMVEGRHFPSDINPADLAWRALAAAASDLAACGAKPLGFTLSLALPKSDAHWLEAFSRGLFEGASAFELALVGGDTTKGPLNIGVQVLGVVPSGAALLRSGAQFGDEIWVSGDLGAARAALDFLAPSKPAMPVVFKAAYYRPTPRLALGQKLREAATAAIDISDGLLSDLNHILVASRCSAQLDISQIPICPDVSQAYASDIALDYALNGGDDYQLCFTAGTQQRALLKSLGCVCIGAIGGGQGLWDSKSGAQLVAKGFSHF